MTLIAALAVLTILWDPTTLDTNGQVKDRVLVLFPDGHEEVRLENEPGRLDIEIDDQQVYFFAIHAPGIPLPTVRTRFFTHHVFEEVTVGSPIRAVHFNAIRTKINGIRIRMSLPSVAWTDNPIVPGVTSVKAVHMTELRQAVTEIYQALGAAPPTYAETITSGTLIRAQHVTELQTLIGSL